jgi:hypothetical protein
MFLSFKFRGRSGAYRSNPKSLFIRTGIGDSKPAVMQEALAL